jgi:hypothetical protein
MSFHRKRFGILAVATCMAAIAVPASGASAAVFPMPTLPTATSLPTSGLPWFGTGPAVAAVGGNQIGTAGCVGTNRPSVGGNAGSTSAQTCGAVLSFNGPQIGQISSVVGPTIIGSVVQAPIQTSASPITNLG